MLGTTGATNGNAALFASNASISQQKGRVSGVVKDEMGPVVGASIVVKGTTNGTITDMDGKFIIDNVPVGSILEISYVGMETQSIRWDGQSSVNVMLKDEAQDLDEVVVVAYGTTKKSSFTGSASVVKSDQLGKISGTGFAEALQGMSAGVNVTNNEGNPGGDTRIQIRGIASMSGQSSPLIIVDGMPYDGSLNTIAPSDIESMTVLKDAAAASLYGSRAANGVLVITTQKGKTGKPVINFRGAWGTSDNAVKNPTKADPYQQLTNTWRAIYNDKYYLEGMSSQEAGDYASQTVLGHMVNPRINSAGETVYVTPFKWTGDASNYVLHDGNGNCWTNPELEMVWDESDYDWYGAVFSRKLRQDYGVDVSGSTENGKVNYYTSLSYLNDKGYANNQYYTRYSFRTNVSAEITNWLSMGGSLAYSYYRQNTSGANRALVFSNTLNSPWLRNEDNTDWYYSEKTGQRIYDFGENSSNFFGSHVLQNGGDYWNNPNDEDFDCYDGNMLTAHYNADIKLPFNIKFRTAVNLDDITKNRYQYTSAIHGDGQLKPYGVTVKTSGGAATRENWRTTSLTWNNVLNWNKTLGDHTIDIMLGHELYSYNKTWTYAYGEGIMQMDQYELASTTTNWDNDSYRNRYTLLSFFGKVDYNFLNKYYLSASLRRDGSSRFHPDNRWGNFFSVGASWRISKEKFLENQTWIDNISLRGSYGTSGNDKLILRNTSTGVSSADDEILYAYQGYYTSDDLYSNAGYKPKSIATPNLKWEKNEQYNIALDFSFWNRFNGTIEFYTRNSKDLLYYKQLPLSAQIGDAEGYNTNLGNIRNRGVEITLGATAIKTQNFQWDINFNLSTLDNEVTYLPDGAYNYENRGAGYRLEEGYSIYEFYMVKNAGVNPETGNMQYWIRDDNGGWTTTESYSDVSSDDYQWCGSAIPNLFGSITNSFRFQNFDLSFMWYASFGSKMWDYQYQERTTVRDGVGIIQDLVEGDVWMQPGDEAKFPRWSASNYSDTRRNSDFYLFDNDYWRLRNLTFGYTLPQNLIRKVGISNVRIYLSGDNLLTFGSAAKRHTEPETGVSGNNYNGNADTDNGVQGSRRVYMAGIQVTF
ncbi:TonB-dependent receptor [Parabacteroides sp. An277]|uniref:SusC/RagA family TonB-linked outer membrane protein n=1 Tax=Parabacteroides sp. An277 TaxID=1965619 RepID=UPI001EF454EB|nr:TonB-dependent receptor [Parabacteroides sp. An277]